LVEAANLLDPQSRFELLAWIETRRLRPIANPANAMTLR
jgi:hypothetical protein